MAITIRSEEFIKHSDGVAVVRMEIDTDTIAELPTVNGISGKKIHQGSTALIMSDCSLLIMRGDGKWIDIAGNVVKE